MADKLPGPYKSDTFIVKIWKGRRKLIEIVTPNADDAVDTMIDASEAGASSSFTVDIKKWWQVWK